MTHLSRATYIAKARLALLAGVPAPPLTEELGLPAWLVEMANSFATDLPLFPLDLLTVCPSNEIPDRIQWQFHTFLCQENITRVKSLPINPALQTEVLTALSQLLSLFTTAIATNTPPPPTALVEIRRDAERPTWSATMSAASNAAWNAAESAMESIISSSTKIATWRTTRSAAESATWRTAESAAWSAAWSSAASAAVSADWNTYGATKRRYAAKLLELLRQIEKR